MPRDISPLYDEPTPSPMGTMAPFGRVVVQYELSLLNRLTPYEVVYGQPAPIHVPYMAGDSSVEAVDRSLATRESTITLLKFHLVRAQTRMKQQADKARQDYTFTVGDWVFVKLHPYRQQSVALRTNQKLSPRYFGPFQITARVGSVAYKLLLPQNAKIHDVFHVSQLKRKIGDFVVVPHVPSNLGHTTSVPVAILADREKEVGNTTKKELLVRWAHSEIEDATWEESDSLHTRFPTFFANLLHQEQKFHTPPTTYVRRRKSTINGNPPLIPFDVH